MSFLFKSSKKAGASQVPNALPPASRDIRSSDGPQSQIPTLNGAPNGAKSPTPAGSASGSLNSLASEKLGMRSPPPGEERPVPGDLSRGQVAPVADQRVRNMSQDDPQRLAMQSRTPPPTDNSSPYPWSQRRLNFTVSHTNPFPRYGAAVNATSSRDGSIYLMGGLINGSTVKGDLWMCETGPGNMSCYPVATTSEGPGPRVGHASLLVGNAFIVFGGDTKMDEGDVLDDTLYLLNTSTKQWSRALPAGPRPPGRYGHTLNILGSKLYIFGGQVEGYFFNDLVAFDLNALQQASNRWEVLIQNTIDGGPPHGQIPPARTNHTMITWGDRLYLFGGTDGVTWFNDVWSYYPHTNSWTQLECIGYIPSAREGHAAALVGDVMYVFGGRTEDGNDLGDLAAFRISSRRWYTFQNMGPSPSPRSGHSMTTVGKQIVVLAGEPSSAPRDPVELGMAYLLDTSKIRYPPDSASQTPTNERVQGHRRPSGEKSGVPVVAANGRSQPRELMERERANSDARARSESNSRLPRPGHTSQLPAPSGPPPQTQPPQPKVNGMVAARQPSRPERALSPTMEQERARNFEDRNMTKSPTNNLALAQETRLPMSPTFDEPGQSYMEAARQKPETYQPSQETSGHMSRSSSRNQSSTSINADRNQGSALGNVDRFDDTPRESIDQIVTNGPKSKEVAQKAVDAPQDSGIGSSPALTQQYDELHKELEKMKQKNAWYASELAIARKAGYQTRSTDSPVMDERSADVFSEDDKPLIEALLKMRSELARMQETIDEQSKSASARISEMERQRDTAINEAVFAKARLAGHGSPQPDKEGARGTPDHERNNDLNKRLASSIAAHNALNGKLESLTRDAELERRARQLAEETADAAQKRVTELDMRHQQLSSEIEGLRSELHETQTQHRDVSANHAEILTQHRLLTVDRDELHGKYQNTLTETENHTTILAGLHAAVAASTEKAQSLESKLESERGARAELDEKLRHLRKEHEERTSELDEATRRLQDAEEMAEKHAKEAESHRAVVLAGFGKVTERGGSQDVNDERVAILQQQLESANAMVRQNQAAADSAFEKLRRAEERIAGLEAYQEQASREGLNIRKQLQSHLRDVQTMTAEKSELEQKLQGQMLETNALAVQHGALKDILAERGINPADVRRSRAVDSPSSMSRFSTPDLHRVRELEQQLEASLKSHDEMKTQFEDVSERDEKMKREYEEKLTALDNDHQAAVKYLRGTEKMLSKMKQELQRVKNENGDLRKKTEKLRGDGDRGSPDGPAADWETERDSLKKEVSDIQTKLNTSVTDLEARIAALQTQLRAAESDLETSRSTHASSQSSLAALQTTHAQSRADLDRLQAENAALDARARDAENKVQLLLDQVEHSVDNYRRQSRLDDAAAAATPVPNGHSRTPSAATTADDPDTPTGPSTSYTGGGPGHARSTSDGGLSIASTTPSQAEGRNSLALDSLASELETLRSHWETTNKNYRLSEKFDFERGTAAAGASGAAGGGLASWRRGLDLGDEMEESRPGTAQGPPGR
ncbi:hypothetical protein WHR41_07359 [Cladosporium halotolerans]|uniref:Cell polarity protein n=1 Tax=Cladosporium halotolerans TaxID=1052096 RepID=A0AB34KGP5_9PEZI